MKKALLGTTALVAGGLIAGVASAADIIPAPLPPAPEPIEEGFTLTVSGDAASGFMFKDSDECDDEVNSFTDVDIIDASGQDDPGLAVIDDVRYANGACVTENANNFDADEDDFVRHDDLGTSVWWDSEIRFTAEQTLANGLTVTARVELEGIASTSEYIDEHWISFAGHFGEIRIGSDDGVVDHLFVGTPGVGAPGATVDGPSGDVFNEEITSDGSITGVDGDANKIIYFTPRFGGLQLGVSYTPDGDGNGNEDSDGVHHVLDSDEDWINIVAVGANYSASYGDYTFELGGGYETGEAETSNDTFEECQFINAVSSGNSAADAFGVLTGDFECGDYDLWALGGAIGGGWGTLGAYYSEVDFDQGFRRLNWAIEGVATAGDWSYGLGYGREEDHHYQGGFEDTQDLWAIGVGNDLAPGVAVGAYALIGNADPAYREALGLGDENAWAAGVSTGLSF